jgi:hypothetical protein
VTIFAIFERWYLILNLDCSPQFLDVDEHMLFLGTTTQDDGKPKWRVREPTGRNSSQTPLTILVKAIQTNAPGIPSHIRPTPISHAIQIEAKEIAKNGTLRRRNIGVYR